MERLSEEDVVGPLFRAAVEASPIAMVLVNRAGNIVFLNSQAERLFGSAASEVVGRPVELLIPEPSRTVHACAHKGYWEDMKARLMAIGRELHGRRRDGTNFPVEIGLNPIETEQRTWALLSIVALTERKKTEAALRESEGRFHNIADTAPVMICAELVRSGTPGVVGGCAL